MSYSGSFRFQRYDVNKTIKNIRFFGYAGGMNSQVHPEKLSDGESVLIENADVVAGGTLINRAAYVQYSSCDEIHFDTFAEITDGNYTFDDLKGTTFEVLNNRGVGIAKFNEDGDSYYKTLTGLKQDNFKLDDMKKHTFNEIKSTGIKGMETGNFQGIFRYKKDDGFIDIIAVKGKLYLIVNTNTYRKLVIKGLRQFQTLRPIEAVQYRDKLYIATGSGLVVYDGDTASLVTGYVPNGLEALYIGTNGYSDSPDTYLQDTTGTADTILGVVPSSRYGITNQPVTFTTYIEKPDADTVEYLYETKNLTDASYTVSQDWGSSKQFSMTFTLAGDYSIRVSLRKVGTTAVLSQYVLPKYSIKATYDTAQSKDVTFANLSTCNRIFVHYDRLFMYGDTTNPDYLYISHLSNFAYFPRTNIIAVVDPLRGKLQNVTRFKDFLVCFTDGSIQQITGTDPTTYAIKPVHTSLGTTQPYSVQVMQNYLSFVGNDNGVYVLKTFNYASSDRMNVERIDTSIKDLIVGHISSSDRILSCIYNNQYYLYVQTPDANYIYRFYYDMNLWVRDVIDMQFKWLDIIGNEVTAASPFNGVIYKMRRGYYYDGTNSIFNLHVKSKDYDMNMPHHRKKMKQFQLLADMTNLTAMTINVYGDNNLLVSKYVTHDPNENTDAEKLKVTTSGRFRYTKVEITIPIVEDIQLLGYAFIFKLNTPK